MLSIDIGTHNCTFATISGKNKHKSYICDVKRRKLLSPSLFLLLSSIVIEINICKLIIHRGILFNDFVPGLGLSAFGKICDCCCLKLFYVHLEDFHLKNVIILIFIFFSNFCLNVLSKKYMKTFFLQFFNSNKII